MDDIQKTLVKAGRKDLAQEYYRKVKAAKEESIADKDAAAAKKIRGQIELQLREVEYLFTKLVDRESGISDFNSPGMKSAIAEALKAGLTRNGFNSRPAIARLKKYYDVR